MDIEKIEKIMSELIRLLEEQGDLPTAAALPVMQIQLLLHIYHKLDAIEAHLAPRPGTISYSSRVY